MAAQRLSILIVDDEPEAARRLERGLRALGHRGTIAADPRDAVDLFRDHHFDGVITDVDMPVLDGIELARRLRLVRAHVPIAFCTGSPHADGELAGAIGAAVIGKDWRRSDLQAVVGRLAELAAVER